MEDNIKILTDILNPFKPISLGEMKKVKLMNRIDTKYVIHISTLFDILKRSSADYYVQTNANNEHMAPYHTVYLDTNDYKMYTRHETKRLVRQKVRIRTYLDTNESFLEIKNKNNRGRTNKNRIVIPDIPVYTSNDESAYFINKYTPFNHCELYPHIENWFSRITLVNQAMTERLTIDVNLRFNNLRTNETYSLDNIAIVELKRDGLSYSPMKDILIRMHVHNFGFSKYCVGCALTNSQLRTNNLKEKLIFVNKLNNK